MTAPECARPLVAEIDVQALDSNYSVLKRAARMATGFTRVFAVAKANAYGHGLDKVLRTLNSTADGYAFVDFVSAAKARKSGFKGPILMLNGMFGLADGHTVREAGLWPVLHEDWQCEWCCAERLPAGTKTFIKVNTGMNRLGFSPERALQWLPKLKRRLGEGNLVLMTHLARADEDGGADRQLRVARRLAGETGLPVSVSNSAALVFGRVSFQEAWARCGLAIYGLSPNIGLEPKIFFPPTPVMTLKSQLISVRTVRRGGWVGYGNCFKAPRTMQVGHVACGYGDGYPRSAGEGGAPALVKGFPSRLVGRVSMDMLAVDLSEVPGAKVGDEVVLLGKGVPAEHVARAARTIAYEVVTGISQRVRRKTVRR